MEENNPLKDKKINKENKKMNNSLMLQGKLTQKVELKTSENGTKYARLPIEVQSEYNGKVASSIYNVTVFGKTAEEAEKFESGNFITIKGRAENQKYENKNVLQLIGTKVESASEGYKNTFSLSGFINNKELALKETANGTKYVSVALSVKNDYANAQNQYDTYFVNAYSKSAERIVKDYNQRDLVEISGAVQAGENGRLNLVGTRSSLIRSATTTAQQSTTQNFNSKDEENSDNGNN